MTRLDKLVELLKQAPDEVFIQPHNVPDPDVIAASFGLKYLLEQKGVFTEIVYENEIEKANSSKMLELFNIKLTLAAEVATLGEEDWTVLVDGQKGNSNMTDLVTDEVAVIDHHEWCGENGYRLVDVRPEVGACSTIITDLKGNQISQQDLKAYAKAFDNVEVYGEVGFLYLESGNDSLLGASSDIVVTIAGGFLPLANLDQNKSLHTFVRHRAISFVENSYQ